MRAKTDFSKHLLSFGQHHFIRVGRTIYKAGFEKTFIGGKPSYSITTVERVALENPDQRLYHGKLESVSQQELTEKDWLLKNLLMEIRQVEYAEYQQRRRISQASSDAYHAHQKAVNVRKAAERAELKVWGG